MHLNWYRCVYVGIFLGGKLHSFCTGITLFISKEYLIQLHFKNPHCFYFLTMCLVLLPWWWSSPDYQAAPHRSKWEEIACKTGVCTAHNLKVLSWVGFFIRITKASEPKHTHTWTHFSPFGSVVFALMPSACDIPKPLPWNLFFGSGIWSLPNHSVLKCSLKNQQQQLRYKSNRSGTLQWECFVWQQKKRRINVTVWSSEYKAK